ncbi:MAG: DUF882 domain-containing protein [Magnetococcales bacterium]|nr:DUF882 domain-containing protein [Magnetococcales bacterium]
MTTSPGFYENPYFTHNELASRDGSLILHQGFLDALIALREAWGRPMRINCCYRTPEHNRAVGGAANSQHLYGNAADVHMPRDEQEAFKALAESMGWNGIGTYQTFIHIDRRDTHARWNG